jgi:hypothetical protein
MHTMVRERSFGLAVAQGILLALCEEDVFTTAKSVFWNQFFKEAKAQLHSWSFTGDLRGLGRIKRVENLTLKIGASLNTEITHMVTPLQREVVTTRKLARGDAVLSLKRCCHLYLAVLAFGRFWKAWRGLMAFLGVLILGFLFVAKADIYSGLFPPAIKWMHSQNYVPEQVKGGNAAPDKLFQLVFQAPLAEPLWIKMTSTYWNNEEISVAGNRVTNTVVAWIPLVKRPDAKGPPTATIQVIYRRKFLGRDGPEQTLFATIVR